MKKRITDIGNDLEKGLTYLEIINFYYVDRITIYKGNDNNFCSIDISFILEKMKNVSFINGFECFCKTEYSKRLKKLLEQNGFVATNKIFEEGSLLTLSK